MTRTRRPLLARQAARLTAVVVFAHPPFWLTSAITRADSDCATLPSRAAAECRRRWLSRPAGAPSGPQEPGQPPVYGIDHRGHGRMPQRLAPARRAIIPLRPAPARLRGDTGHRVVRIRMRVRPVEEVFL